MASTHRRIRLTGLAWTLVSTSPHAPRLRPRLLPLVAIRFTNLIHLSAIAGATVFTIQSISPAVRCSQGFATNTATTRPTTDIAVTSVRAHLERNLTALHCIGDCWWRNPAVFTVTHCDSSSSPLMHPPSFVHTRNSFLSCNLATNSSSTAANTCAHFVQLHCNSTLPLHWPRWFASDTHTHLSPDPASFTKDDTRAPPLLSKHLAFASPLATTIWTST